MIMVTSKSLDLLRVWNENSVDELLTAGLLDNAGNRTQMALDLILKEKENKIDFKYIASYLCYLWPDGYKSGNTLWKENSQIITQRLEIFSLYYDVSSFKESDYLNAAERYLKTFQDDLTYMYTLRNFIFWHKISCAGAIEEGSMLLNYLENKNL